MITNLSNLMADVSRLERQFSRLVKRLDYYNMNEKAIDLNHKEMVLVEYPNFEKDLAQAAELQNEISRLRGIIYEKNNSYILSTGKSIQASIADLTSKRTLLSLYDDLLEKSPSKERVTEVNNSYYLSKELAFNKDNLQEKREILENEISQMEFEISKFNSETFEV